MSAYRHQGIGAGEVTLTLELDTPGTYIVTAEPPLTADLQLAEPLKVTVA